MVKSNQSRNLATAPGKYQTEVPRRPGDVQVTMPEIGGPERTYRPAAAYMQL